MYAHTFIGNYVKKLMEIADFYKFEMKFRLTLKRNVLTVE
ncbi:Hypothetical protein Bdt_2168 [Bdellovibrio bacteriovorus str. Tiberius]|uniref:Uncharacterized protein n=1 Tax=Bdellovibrio bacteriovorus str. Tiberius TaxID=1069642 RepID=K7YW10_BDEBC|nr:Hypothetical protein Bdt_2168 [Bdellovibrio bacteriovorus str. Tiberius]